MKLRSVRHRSRCGGHEAIGLMPYGYLDNEDTTNGSNSARQQRHSDTEAQRHNEKEENPECSMRWDDYYCMLGVWEVGGMGCGAK